MQPTATKDKFTTYFKKNNTLSNINERSIFVKICDFPCLNISYPVWYSASGFVLMRQPEQTLYAERITAVL